MVEVFCLYISDTWNVIGTCHKKGQVFRYGILLFTVSNAVDNFFHTLLHIFTMNQLSVFDLHTK